MERTDRASDLYKDRPKQQPLCSEQYTNIQGMRIIGGS